ncbi:tip elongation aberrant protein 1-like [Gastrolobium bilobum]|uniref:tip elongation aberrant protein 1-like n=1 Tax=Gastrolobium bilobum TaxID=150636 RepID=UPI002AB02CF4|nr:tip elongation aberrant protein 1-like [Gastrolobium bilobum]
MRWEKVQVNPIAIEGGGGGGGGQSEVCGPGKRWGHTCNAIKGGRLVYVFGGYGKHNCQTNQVHVFDTVKQTWSQPAIKGSSPTPRDSHTCTAIGDNLFVFGGTDGMNPLKDLHILDTSSHTWISPTIRGEGPEAREGHSAAVVGKRLFIFGGCGKSADNNNEVYYNDLYILNTETFVWKFATTSGSPPSPRDSHTCSSWKNKIIVIGGEDGHDYYLSDVHILDADTLIWRELSTSGQLLPPRAGHSTVSFGKNLFVFGGFTDAQNLYNDLYMLDVDTGIWTNVTTTNNGPSARFSVAGDCLDPFKGGVLVFIGGCNKSLEALDDMYYLYTGIARESEQRPEKLSLRKQLKLKCQEQNLNPGQNQVLVRYGVGADISPIMSVLNYSQPSRQNIPVNQSLPPGKKMFEAKVTENISEGYTIETVIDGKPLRGILFLNKPNSLHPAAHTSSRKRTAGEIDGVISNGIHPNKLKTPKVIKQNEMENRQVVPGDSTESHENRIEAVSALISSDRTTANASATHKVSANPEPEAAFLNRNNENNETPKSLWGNLKNDGANEVISSKGEVQTNDQTNVPISNFEVSRHDKTSDAPNCNTEFLKPAAAESAVCLSNQGAMVDSTPPRTGECSEPAKLI